MAPEIQAVLDEQTGVWNPVGKYPEPVTGPAANQPIRGPTMKAREVYFNRSPRSQQPHDHVAVLVLDGPNWVRFRSFFEPGDAGVVILDAQVDGIDRIVVQAGCATQEVLERLCDGWA